ncbi:TonB-dependent receptor [Carboxylicivirga mesophila]|uniref:TonB-dependent receptor n=1 Tax=Carboxylicivirga mesophila TaxID=1166478 RepID=A0ABS5K6L2_9BACT|nr:TonB-dependent receptor [Carboxylicivirga mesophila]MBS2210151.1 TonB-dependent receptor [Carboxylicivirga mesophila]
MIKRLLIAFWMIGHIALAQDAKTVTGVIRDDAGFELPGASVLVKGTLKGTATNFEGQFVLEDVLSTDILVISYIGMQSQEVKVGDKDYFEFTLAPDASDLEEVVVIGYGTSKSKDLTSPIATISAEEITSMSASSAMGAVQGKVAGVTIVNSGVPGEGPQVSIRGVGSIQNSNPLYVVDGMFLDDINFLSPNDIETMSVLKDASAAAIYGVRAANGVVLITTKSGSKNREMQVSYDGYYGVQLVTQRLDMANSEQYATLMRAAGNEQYVDAAIARWGGTNGIPAVSTDWYDELIRSSAPIQNHNLSLNGGNEKSAYSFSLGYFGQDGIMNSTGYYDRFNLRGKVDYDVSSKLKVGFSTILTKEKRMTDDESAWFQAYVNNPMYAVYDDNLADGESFPKPYGNPHNLGYDTYYTNPVARAYYHSDNQSDITRFMPNIYAELRPFDSQDIVFRSAMNMDFRYGAASAYIPDYKVGNTQQVLNSLSKTTNWNYDYVWDNTVTWRKSWGSHNLTSMGGLSVREENYRWLNGTAQGVTNKDYLNSGIADTRTSDDGGTRFRGMSVFTRFSYDYQHKYLLSLTMRADGSSKYQQKWGYFPSLGAGWVVSQEDFASGLTSAKIDHLKVRASWGLLGNDRVPANSAFGSIAGGDLGSSGIFGGSLVPGMINNRIFTDLEWELVDEKNIGIETKMFDYRLNVEADYYNRETRNMVILTTLPMGNGNLLQNAGSVRNSGVEVMVNWSDKIGKDFHYSIGGNITTIKNRVTDLSGEPYLQTGSAEFPQRSYVGGALYSFYGWKTDGVYQTQAEIDADPIARANGLKPGDFRYVDTNGDGVIDDNDRVLLGDPNPDFTYGINMAVGYKGFTLAATFQGVQGVTIFNRRRADINKHGANNVDANLANSVWTGPGSTNSTPSAEGLYNPWNTGRLNDFFLEDGSYFRIQNVRLSYDIPKSVMNKFGLGASQVYLNADRPYTFFSSNGFTPEVPGGIDESVYPIPAIFSLGLRLNF